MRRRSLFASALSCSAPTSSTRSALALWAAALLASLPLVAQAAVPLGTVVDAPLLDLHWQPRRLAELRAKVTVLFFATIDCPLVQRYLPRLGRLARDYEARDVVFVVVNVGSDDAFVDAAGQVAEVAPAAIFAKDEGWALVDACGIDRTGAAIVLDEARRMVYRGRVDDQFGYAGARDAPTREDLRLAIDAVLAGATPEIAETPFGGCRISRPQREGGGDFASVAALVNEHCVVCHRPGGEAPFALTTDAQVRRHGEMIAEVVEQGRMPPWYGSSRFGAFVNRRVLDAEQRALVQRWADAGLPGPVKAVSAAPVVTAAPTAAAGPAAAAVGEADGRCARPWRIGEPDLVIELKAPVRLPADGVIPYRYFALPHRFAQETWIEAIEIRPENERVLHHCNLACVQFGESFSQENFLTGYVPGGDAMVLDPGTAVRLPAGSVLALQAHYVTTGRPETDRLAVGLRFPRVKVERELHVTIAGNTRFTIPAGARAHAVRARRRIPQDAVGIGLYVHMHQRGRDMLVSATAPDGASETLLLVPNYSFEWQQSYRWAVGERRFAAGTVLHALAHFDNSAWNTFNPDPTEEVRFGLQTDDEMMYAFLFWVPRDQQLGLEIDPTNGVAR